MSHATSTRRRKPEYMKTIEQCLYDYPILKASIENERELEKEGLSNLFPSITPVYEERASKGYSEYQSQTEKYGILRARRIIQYRQINRAMNTLTTDERRVIEERYINPNSPTDQIAYDRLGISRSTFNRLKMQAIRKMARALNVI